MKAESVNPPSVKSLGLWIHSTLSITGEGSRRDGIVNIARPTVELGLKVPRYVPEGRGPGAKAAVTSPDGKATRNRSQTHSIFVAVPRS